MLHKVFVCGQGHSEGRRVRTECTCTKTYQKYCKVHDYSLLWELSKCLPNVDRLYDIGLDLNIDPHEINASIMNNSRSIAQAVYDMLCKWYQTQDGLGRNSNGLEELVRTLRNNNLDNYVQTVVQKHFNER